MKILYVTDTHIRGTSPQSRLDDFPQALLAKLREVVELAAEHQVAAILHGGDLFDRPDVAPAVALDFLRVLMDAPCPIYGIAGNHDIFGFNPGTVPRTMLGIFDGFRLFRLIKPGEIVWLEEDGLRVQVTGQEFHAELDRRSAVLDYCVVPEGMGGSLHERRAEADFALHLTHGMLLEKPFFEGSAHTLLDAVMSQTVADVTFGGHYHPGWSKILELDGRLFVNPGSLVRIGYQAADYKRPIQVALVELNRGQPARAELIRLKCARPGEEVLDKSTQQAQMARERALADFIQGIGDTSQFEVLEVQAIMERIADNQGVPQRVKEEALRRLGLAQEELARGGEELQ
ncbi:MAG TPA: metallophosphoesterase [Symbiobacteriaceae bacterium]|nr:metallophosphoesterase [Symbiobacteriaceae bacterium]